MTIKEKPLINAVSNLGALPSPSGPILSGVYTSLMACLFGAVANFFLVYPHGTWVPKDLAVAVVVGSWAGVSFVGVCYLLILFITPREEARTTVPFVLSGLITGAFCAAAGVAVSSYLWEWPLTLDFISSVQ